MADFFDKMIAGVSKGVETVSTNSKIMIEKAKINTKIKELGNEKKELAALLGMKVYGFGTAADIPYSEVESFCNEMANRDNLIAEQQELLKAVEASANPAGAVAAGDACSCGNVNAAGAKFCASCGNAL